MVRVAAFRGKRRERVLGGSVEVATVAAEMADVHVAEIAAAGAAAAASVRKRRLWGMLRRGDCDEGCGEGGGGGERADDCRGTERGGWERGGGGVGRRLMWRYRR